MAQINDLLVLGESNLLGTLNVFGDVTAPNFFGKATSAINDGNGDEIATTYLKRSGGTMTGNIFMKGANPYIAFQDADGVTQGYVQYVASTDSFGIGTSMAAGLTVISNGSLQIPANQTITTATTNTGSVGTSALKWNAMYATTFYGALSGNATTSSYPLGFSSRSDNATWGSQVGSTVTCWNESSGGSVDWRRNNPSEGKISLKVDGRVYVNEGLNPLLGAVSDGSYWAITNPDGDSNVYIRSPQLGIIPYASGGIDNPHQTIGTDGWRFSSGYINTIYGRKLYLGKSDQSSITTNSGIYIHDLRNMTITPDTFGDCNLNFYFDEITLEDSSNGSWKGIMHMKGWKENYVAWQLAGTATSSVKNKLYYREGVKDTWQKWMSVAFENRANTFDQKGNKFTNGLYVKERITGSGDDEGIQIDFASNGYAGLVLGTPSGKRSVFYLKSDTSAWWRYNNGSASYDLYHPVVSGTIIASPANKTGTANTVPKFTGSYTLENSNIIDDNTTITLKRSVVVECTKGSYNEGIRIIPKSAGGWSNVFFSNDRTTEGTHASGWLIGKRGAAGTIGAAGDFTIEPNSSDGKGLTIHTSGSATLYGNFMSIANKIALTYVADTESLDFIFA